MRVINNNRFSIHFRNEPCLTSQMCSGNKLFMYDYWFSSLPILLRRSFSFVFLGISWSNLSETLTAHIPHMHLPPQSARSQIRSKSKHCIGTPFNMSALNNVEPWSAAMSYTFSVYSSSINRTFSLTGGTRGVWATDLSWAGQEWRKMDRNIEERVFQSNRRRNEKDKSERIKIRKGTCIMPPSFASPPRE